MPSQQGYDNFPIGTGAHYVDYTLSSQLNSVTIPPTRHHSSDDSDPGSPPTRQGGSRPHAHHAQAQVDPVLLGHSGGNRTYSSRMGMSTSSGGPYGHNLTINSALRSTTTPYYDRHTRTPDSPDLTRSGSPTGSIHSVHSDRSASASDRSFHSDESSYRSQSRQPTEARPEYDGTDFAHPPRGYPFVSYQDAAHQQPHPPPSHLQSQSQHMQYHRMGEYQGVIAPEFETDDTLRYAQEFVPASGSSSATSEARVSQIPPPSFPTAPDGSDAEQYLRHQLGLPRDRTVDLWALQDPPEREKPSQPLPNLVKLAIFGSPKKKLTLQEIYRALVDRFDWFKDHEADLSWKNSIRHNLSLNKVFKIAPRPITEPGKGSYWTLDLTQGEGYKRPRVRKTRAQQREINNAKNKAGQDADESSGSDEAPSPQTPSSAHPIASGSGSQGSNPGADESELRQTGALRSRPRRANSGSPYPLRQTPSPAHGGVSEMQLEPDLRPSSAPHMAQGSMHLDPMLMDQGSQPMFDGQQQLQQPAPMMESYHQGHQQPFSHPQPEPSFGQPSFPSPAFSPYAPQTQLPAFAQPSSSDMGTSGSSGMPFMSGGYNQTSLMPAGAVVPQPRDRSHLRMDNSGVLPRLRHVTPPQQGQQQQQQQGYPSSNEAFPWPREQGQGR